MKTTLKSLEASVGGLSWTSAMPCPTYSLSARDCHTGSKLARCEGSICSVCYGAECIRMRRKTTLYVTPKVQAAATRHTDLVRNDPHWARNMSILIAARRLEFFRWHDAGDIQSIEHLNMIVRIARDCPFCSFWLPTKEYSFVRLWIESHGALPDNLCVRLSGYMVNGPAPSGLARRLGVQTSTVVSDSSFTCLKQMQMGQCGTCRACWDKSVENVSYRLH